MSDHQRKEGVGQLELRVTGMTCGGCSSRVEEALMAVPGVLHATADHEKDSAIIEGKNLDPETLIGVIRDRGFEASTV